MGGEAGGDETEKAIRHGRKRTVGRLAKPHSQAFTGVNFTGKETQEGKNKLMVIRYWLMGGRKAGGTPRGQKSEVRRANNDFKRGGEEAGSVGQKLFVIRW